MLAKAIALVAIFAILTASGTVLAITGHPGWAWIPFVLLLFVRVTDEQTTEKGRTKP